MLYANPFPADWAIHAYYSRVIELPSGALLCVYRRAQALYGDDGRSWVLRSTDGGRTWQDEGCLWDGSADDRPYSYAATNLTLLRDGSIALTGLRTHRPAPDLPRYGGTGANFRDQHVVFHSSDEGRTWSAPIVPAIPDAHYDPYDSVTELADGRWFVTSDWSVTSGESERGTTHVCGLYSDDRGATWHSPLRIAGDAAGAKGFWHTRLMRLADGRLLGFPWAGAPDGSAFHTLHRVVGSPDGGTWSEPEPTTLRAQTNRPADAGDGAVALVMSVRESDRPGLYVALSEDEGRTWDTDRWVQVWDAYGQDALGVPRTESYPAAHDNIAFGAPDLIRLEDGDLLANFWAGMRGQMVVRWCRLRVR